MSAIIWPTVHFGTGYKTPLPPGWELCEKPRDWAIGISPDGQEYFLGKNAAYPRREMEGKVFIDFVRGVIPLNAEVRHGVNNQ